MRINAPLLYTYIPLIYYLITLQPYLIKVRTIQKKMQTLEGQFDCCTEQLFEVGLKLEHKEKVIGCMMHFVHVMILF